MSGFESVGQILPQALKKTKAADDFLALRAKEIFSNSLKAVFSSKKLPKITAGKFSYGTLTVLVPDPAWAMALRQKEDQILEKLNGSLGRKVVEKLRFRVVAR